jgi:flagellar protein FlbT
MALKIALRPHEKIIIGESVIANGPTRSALMIENSAPILRQKDIMAEREADTPCKKIYFVIQLMYLDEKNLRNYHEMYWRLVQDIVNAAPSTLGLIDKISDHILNNRYYYALKAARTLVNYEREVTRRVRNATSGV